MPALFTQPQALDAAAREIGLKTVIGSRLNSAQWSGFPAQLRRRAFFSAKVTKQRFLEIASKRILQFVKMERRALASGKSVTVDRSGFIKELQELAISLGLAPGEPEEGEPDLRGTIQDITSERRLRLIFDVQAGLAYGYAKWLSDQRPAVLDSLPAYEFMRFQQREEPRLWLERWKAEMSALGPATSARVIPEGGSPEFGGFGMVALKNDPIWVALSRFGQPFPPFDFNSGMGLRDVRRRDAVRWGLMAPDDTVSPAEMDFNQDLEVSRKGFSDASIDQLKQTFGDRITITKDKVKWNPKSQAKREAALKPELPDVKDRVKPVRIKDKATRDAVNEALGAVAKVHKDGELPEVKFLAGRRKTHLGTYFPKASRKVETKLEVRPNGPWKALTAAHEIGHLVDNMLLNDPTTGFRWATSRGRHSSSPLKGFFEAVHESQAAKALAANLKAATLDKDRRQAGYLKTLTQDVELFARVYAQWIALRSKSQVLMDQVELVRKSDKWRQWAWDDFAPIAAELDKVFAEKGLLVKQPKLEAVQ